MTDPNQPQWSEPTWQQPAPPPAGQPAQPPAEYAVPPNYPPPAGPPGMVAPVYVVRKTNGLAIAALVCAVAGLAPVGAILGHVARRDIRLTGEDGDGLALAGIIVGGIFTGLWLCMCALYLGFFGIIAGNGGFRS